MFVTTEPPKKQFNECVWTHEVATVDIIFDIPLAYFIAKTCEKYLSVPHKLYEIVPYFIMKWSLT